jgi:hypothetical protein
MNDYVEEGYLAALREVRAICGTETMNAVGYCIAGTTLALTLALMKRRGEASVNSATFFTTLTDFSDQGEVGVFLDNDFVDGIEQVSMQKGILESFYMARTFSWLRSNDLIYQPAIRNYMLGETPPAFDLLYWNSDGTNLPATMADEYLAAFARTTASPPPASRSAARRCTSRRSRCRSAAWLRDGPHRRLEVLVSRAPRDGSEDKTLSSLSRPHRRNREPRPPGQVRPLRKQGPVPVAEDWLRAAEKHAGALGGALG